MFKKLLLGLTFAFILFCLFTYLFIDANFFYLKSLYSGFATSERLITTITFILFISVLYLLFTKILNFTSHHNGAGFTNYKFLLLIPFFGILAYPAALSFDLFNYIATAKVAFHYFENPYVVMPIELIGEPILVFTRATNKIALYGPLWTLISGIPYSLSFGNYLLTIVLFKLFVLLFFFGTVWFIWKITKNFYSVMFFAASPLVLIETFVSGHNDAVMMFFALGSFYFLRNKKFVYAALMLLLSIFIKYATVFLIPLLIYIIYKNIKRQEINWNKVYFIGFILMLLIFFLSPTREEIYPWYAIWPLTFLSLIAQKRKIIASLFIFFTYCLMLRYVPYMATGNYFGITPYVKLVITFILPALYGTYLFIKDKKNFKNEISLKD